MDEYAAKFRRILMERKIHAEHLVFTQSCHSVAEAVQAVQASPEEFVKNICLIAPEGQLIVAIVKGEDRVSLKGVGQALGMDCPRLANADEILDRTGYPCGGTPSLGFEALFVVDERVLEVEQVYTGGGSEQALMKIAPQEILRESRAIVARIRK